MNRREWANFFDGEGIQYAFFSAANAVALQQARRDALIDEEGAGHTSKEIEKDDHAIARDTQVPSGDRFDHELEGTIHQESEGDGGSAVSEGSLAESDLDDDEFCNDLYVPLNDPNDELDPRTKVLSVLELESLFVSSAPDLSGEMVYLRMKSVSARPTYLTPRICGCQRRGATETYCWTSRIP